MSLATLIRRMAEAGAPPEAIALAVEEIEALQASLDARRSADRDRKREQRKRQKTADVTGQSEDIPGTVTDTPALEVSQTLPKPTPAPPFSPPSSPKRGTRLSDDFEAPDDWIAWAVKKRGWSKADAIDEAECFARYWQAKPGREACKLDWPKTWQNWVVNSKRLTVKSTGPPSYLDVYEREMRLKSAVSN
jgi:hypothetical protein